MAIVEDEPRNDNDEENEIEVMVEEYVPDSDDSDEDDDDDVRERKVAELESRIAEDPYNYDDHNDLIQVLWRLSELERWRTAFERLQQMSAIKPEHWLLRLQTEESLAHSDQTREKMAELFHQASLDCYSIPILTEWCTWALNPGDIEYGRAQMDEVLRRAGADPFSGKIFWDAKLELEKAQFDTMSETDEKYKEQQERVVFCLEEMVSRPLLRGEESWQLFSELALVLFNQEYVDKVKEQHEAATEYLQKVTPFEDKLLTLENPEEKFKVFEDYIETVKDLSYDEKYDHCHSNGILRVLYDRVSTECMSQAGCGRMLEEYVQLAHRSSSRTTAARIVDSCIRRCPRHPLFWTLKMQQAEYEEKSFDEVKAIFETALSKGMEKYRDAESLWMGYLEFARRRTAFDSPPDVERLRRTFRLAWDSLAEAWGEDANDCEVPLFWTRLEYRRMKDFKAGRDIFEEMLRYGENKSLSKYWEAIIHLEMERTPQLPEHKLRELYRRALRCVRDYTPVVAGLWTNFERDHGNLITFQECYDTCEVRVQEWRDSYREMKEKMRKAKGKPDKGKGQKFDSKKKRKQTKEEDVADKSKKGKRKSDQAADDGLSKKKRDGDMEVDEVQKKEDAGGVKRSHDDDKTEATEVKRQRTDSPDDALTTSREACTLFVSNLDFKVDETSLRKELSKYGDIVSLRVKAGVKAFGGSICYCQYKTPESVNEAVQHDRSPLAGRPMFLSRYAGGKAKPTFKYATTAEANKLFVKNLPFTHCTKQKLTEMFEKYGKLKDVRPVTYKDGRPKGLAYIDYEDEASARAAILATHGSLLAERRLDVAVSAPPPRAPADGPALGQHKRDPTGGMRRTQLSSFIPSVLQKPSTSAANGNGAATSNGNGTATSNGNSAATSNSNGDKRSLSNTDFRSMLLDKK